MCRMCTARATSRTSRGSGGKRSPRAASPGATAGRRAGGRGADHPVARLHAEVFAAERPAELDHAALDPAQNDDVVDGGGALPVRIDVERRQLDDAIVTGEDAREPR